MSNYYRTTRRRRQRYTVEFAGEAMRVILAYSADDARYFYARQGKSVLRVTKGDYRKTRAAQYPTPAPAKRTWVVNQKALDEAKKTLGIEKEVKIRYHARRGRTNGNHRFFWGQYHDIMLKSYHTAEQANETLWHELTHAMQSEKAGFAAWEVLHKELKGSNYRNRAIEREAREMATKMKHIKLVKEI